ncbi:MAG: hypothetical protein LJF04_17680 [Gemmatimonadetes bacterium]|nr:hypothetical protein [Gemmatimonadota bacterium]
MPARSQAVEPAVYEVSFPSPEEHIAAIEATLPTRAQPAVEVMIPIWSPGYYRVEDYAAQVHDLTAHGPEGQVLDVRRIPPNRWRIGAGGMSRIVLSYRLSCTRYFVTTNWVSPELGVLNGPATFITLVGDAKRPQQVHLELPPSWPRVATGLAAAPDGNPHHYQARDYDELVDAPILAGNLQIHEFVVQGVPHYLADAGAPEAWDGDKVAADLGRIVEQTLPLWGKLPYAKYVFLNVFRPGAGGLEHGNSTLLTTRPERAATKRAYDGWLGLAAHEYMHALNVKRLRPVELGPFDYEVPPRTSSLWLAEGVTSYLANLAVARAGLTGVDDFLASLSGTIRQLQESPGRLLQTLEQSSLEVWSNSNSGVGAAPTTVSYYVKGEVVGFLLDARARAATGGRRSLDDVMHAAYLRYGGERGYTPKEFCAVAEEVAGPDLEAWFRKAIASTEELDYSEALEWFGVRFVADGTWSLAVRADATADQAADLRDLLRSRASSHPGSRDEPAGLRELACTHAPFPERENRDSRAQVVAGKRLRCSAQRGQTDSMASHAVC